MKRRSRSRIYGCELRVKLRKHEIFQSVDETGQMPARERRPRVNQSAEENWRAIVARRRAAHDDAARFVYAQRDDRDRRGDIRGHGRQCRQTHQLTAGTASRGMVATLRWLIQGMAGIQRRAMIVRARTPAAGGMMMGITRAMVMNMNDRSRIK